MSDRKELLKEAEKLGLEFPKNIPTDKLEVLIENSLETEQGDKLTEEEQAAEDAEKAAEEKSKKEETAAHEKLMNDVQKTENVKGSGELSRKSRIRKKIAESKKKAFKTSVVTLTNKDNRENDVMTTVNLSFENQHFGLSKIVPLDVPVELEKALIDIAESTRITLHKDEIVDGKRTGNRVPVSVKKFAISYSSQQTGE